MSWNFLISFAIGFGVYLVAVGIFGIIKRHKIKKQIESEDSKEVIENENKESKD